MKRLSRMSAFLCCVCGVLGPRANAAIIPIAPFQGSLSETWESFPTFDHEDDYLVSPTTILHGAATIANPFMVIYEPGIFGLGTSGPAQVADGIKAMGLNHYAQTAEIVFHTPVLAFGAYWGAVTDQYGGSPAMIDVSLFDSNDTLIANEVFSYLRPGDGVLEWHGWSSEAPIKRLTYAEDGVVIDGLQANPVPEPATLALFASALLLRRRARP